MVYTGKSFDFVEFFEIFQEYSRNMQIFNVHPGTFSTFQEYAWYIVCCTGYSLHCFCVRKYCISRSAKKNNKLVNFKVFTEFSTAIN